MKKIGIITMMGLMVFVASCNAKKANLDTLEKKQSYAYGFLMGKNFADKKVPVDLSLINIGLSDGISAKPQLTEQELTEAIMAFQETMQRAHFREMEARKSSNLQESKSFLIANKKAKDVVALKSGLQYKVLKSGKGASPKSTDTVVVHYRGTLLDGTEFDSSYRRNAPAEFKVTQVIKGWTEALQKMKVGDKWKLFIPPDLAYGERGTSGNIGPNMALIFEVELMDIK